MDLGRLLEDSGAVLRGHFVLSSGRHSDVYFEKFRVLEQPHVLTALCAEIADHFRTAKLDAVAGPLTGGIIIAFEVARQMNLPAVYVESENGQKTLRRGKTLEPGTRVLVVDDVLTTGLSVNETIQAIQNAGGEVAGVAVLIDRASDAIDFGCPQFAAFRVQAQSYDPQNVPESLAEIPIQKPGSRA
ncbi:MAG TPA: orotate phosphoribosyltransferase [Fimbriimonadaceae bacterium]|nr:orotate phosphoribosyltransferase [Fimbriimonadaceae bacterium]